MCIAVYQRNDWRQRNFIKVFGKPKIPIVGGVDPIEADLDGESSMMFFLDRERVSKSQLDQIAALLGNHFGVGIEEIYKDFESREWPIKYDESVLVVRCDGHIEGWKQE